MPEIALHIMDLVQNSISALAKNIKLLLKESLKEDSLTLTIEDDGKGMAPEFLEKVTSPFTTTRTTRKVGMGIPLLKAGCEGAGGEFHITSQVNVGTKLVGRYQLSHLDRPPLGDFVGTVHTLVVCNPGIDFYIEVGNDNGTFVLDTREIRAQIGDMPLDTPEISLWIKEYLEEGMGELHLTA